MSFLTFFFPSFLSFFVTSPFAFHSLPPPLHISMRSFTSDICFHSYPFLVVISTHSSYFLYILIPLTSCICKHSQQPRLVFLNCIYGSFIQTIPSHYCFLLFLSIHLSVYISIYLSIYFSTYLSIFLYFLLSLSHNCFNV